MGVSMEPSAFVAHVQGLLSEVQAALLAEATAFRDANIVDVTSYEELKAAVAEGARGRAGATLGGRARRRGRAGASPGAGGPPLGAIQRRGCAVARAASQAAAALWALGAGPLPHTLAQPLDPHPCPTCTQCPRQVGARRLGRQRRAGEADQGGDAGDAALLPLRPTGRPAHVLHDGTARR
jgi:hypothetical protein